MCKLGAGHVLAVTKQKAVVVCHVHFVELLTSAVFFHRALACDSKIQIRQQAVDLLPKALPEFANADRQANELMRK